jgi:hypothetical protein
MNERSRFIKSRVNDEEYTTLRQRADAQGVTMSQYVRDTVTAVHESLDVASELAALRQQVRQALSSLVSRDGGDQREMLLLLRELAAARDAQILARVRAQLAAQGGNADKRVGAV